ncbi:LacI family DNA-binding transcriptional regulator [Agaribacter marinus]|uniref:Transcriptional regulator n=1 Tax=Agaribacter marinus TaxID=1431249 RepID=A0AA37WG73_9ALTE|nr:LacI family DNA-binding transcriptional regulator [Agaribacter marinus]GLR69826.1 transcriptional regulator [Agaribacter marinus]
MATIKDVARLAGVSTATVSRVVHGLDLVSDKARIKVQKAIAELNYRPNTNARALKSRKAELIGMVTPNLSAPFFGALASGIEEAARKHNYKVMMRNSLYETETEIEAIESLREHGCQNIILHSDFSDDETLTRLAEEFSGLVIVNRFIPAIANRCVWLDNQTGGRMMAEYLLRSGHTDIAFISSTYKNRDPVDRLKGSQQVLMENGLNVPDSRVILTDPDIQGAKSATKALIDSGAKVSAIVAYNDMMAVGVMNALQEAGIQVPEEVSVMGFDDLFICLACHPHLTTMKYPVAEMGAYATSLTIELTNKPDTVPSRTHLFMPELVARESVLDLGEGIAKNKGDDSSASSIAS